MRRTDVAELVDAASFTPRHALDDPDIAGQAGLGAACGGYRAP